MTTATGTREVPFARHEVWLALTTPLPYCQVCDVSYVFTGAGDATPTAMRTGTTFVCVPGRLEGEPPRPTAPRGQVTGLDPERRVSTRLELTSEIWDTEIELADCGQDSTRVTFTVTCEPKGGGRLLRRLQRHATQQWVERTVDSELAKVPEHVRQAMESPRPATAVEQRTDGRVLHLRGDVRPPVMPHAELERILTEGPVVVVDVSGLTYLDATGLHVLARWARDAARAGRPAVVRGESPHFDTLSRDLGATSLFTRNLSRAGDDDQIGGHPNRA